MKKNYGLLLLCFCTAFNTIAVESTSAELASFREKVDRAITKFENTNKALWSYQVSRYEDEEGDISSSIEQHLPQANERWQLKQINGKAPTKKQLKRYLKKKQEQSKAQKPQGGFQLSLRELINPESLSLVSTDENQIVMAFDVNISKLGKDSVGKLQGQLVYQKEHQFIEQISVWNNAEFSPMFTASITDLAINFTFFDIKGAVLAKQNEMKMKGSFAYFSEIDETSIDRFSDYSYQGEQINHTEQKISH